MICKWNTLWVFLEALSAAVMSRPVTNLNFTPFCNSVEEVTVLLYAFQNTQHQKHPQTLNHILMQFSFRYVLVGSIFFPSVTVHCSYFRHTCNCCKGQTGQSTVRWSNPEKSFLKKILSYGISEPCTPLIKQELHSWIKKNQPTQLTNTLYRNTVRYARTYSATQQLPKTTPAWKHHHLRRDQKKLFHSFISKWHMHGQFTKNNGQ